MHFLQSKEAYRQGRALVFYNIDYLFLTLKLLQKDYMHLASCLVPMGDQIGMSQQELADMLRTKTRQFTEEDIQQKFSTTASAKPKRKNSSWSTIVSRTAASWGITGSGAESSHLKAT